MFMSPMWPCQHTNISVLTCIQSAWSPILILCHGNWLIREGVHLIDLLHTFSDTSFIGFSKFDCFSLHFCFSPYQLIYIKHNVISPTATLSTCEPQMSGLCLFLLRAGKHTECVGKDEYTYLFHYLYKAYLMLLLALTLSTLALSKTM